MAFIDDHPDYKTYVSSNGNHYHDVPPSVWTPLESLVEEAGGYEGKDLVRVVSLLARKIRFGHVDPSFAFHAVPEVVSSIKKNVKAGKFDVFMDCLSILCVDGKLNVDVLNEFLEEYSIGYMLDYRPPFSNPHWVKVETEDNSLGRDQSEMPSGLIYKIPLGGIIKEEKIMPNSTKSTKIFITHSSDDEEYILLLTELLRNIKVDAKEIVCTTDPIHKIPNGNNAFEWLKNQFIEYDLHMIFVLSENYYASIPCLNEMGAAWLVAKRSDVLLLPKFSFSAWNEKGGCLSSNIQAGSIDTDGNKLKAWLNELKNVIIDEFGLSQLNELEWEKYRDEFIDKMKAVKIDSKETIGETKCCTSDKLSDNPVVKAIFDAGGEIKGISALMTATGLSSATVKIYIQKAIEREEIERIGPSRNFSYRLKSKS